MMLYRFAIHYQSSAGSWVAGDTAELDADTAAWLLRDVPGCIVPVDAPDGARAIETPPQDRQIKRVPRDRQRHADDGVMTPENTGAVKRAGDA